MPQARVRVIVVDPLDEILDLARRAHPGYLLVTLPPIDPNHSYMRELWQREYDPSIEASAR